MEAVLRKLDLASVEELGGAHVVKMTWFTDCMKAGRVVDVLEEHQVQSDQRTEVMYLIVTVYSGPMISYFGNQPLPFTFIGIIQWFLLRLGKMIKIEKI